MTTPGRTVVSYELFGRTDRKYLPDVQETFPNGGTIFVASDGTYKANLEIPAVVVLTFSDSKKKAIAIPRTDLK
jgi:hypothetical protein